MGKYSEGISERIKHVKIKTGYCLVCGIFGELTEDHVPPKGSITITKIEQRHITEMMGVNKVSGKGVLGRNGSKFKTICRNCNNVHVGGENDAEVARVCKALTLSIKNYFESPHNPYTTISVDVNAKKYIRAMIGHILAATSVTECQKKSENSPYFEPLKQFVLGDYSAIDKTHDIYYWFYPSNKHISAKCVVFFNNHHQSMLSLLSFFPIAFLITKKNEGTYPSHSKKLSLTDKCLNLDLSFKGYAYAEFPFLELQGNQMMLLADSQAIISYPIGQ